MLYRQAGQRYAFPDSRRKVADADYNSFEADWGKRKEVVRQHGPAATTVGDLRTTRSGRLGSMGTSQSEVTHGASSTSGLRPSAATFKPPGATGVAQRRRSASRSLVLRRSISGRDSWRGSCGGDLGVGMVLKDRWASHTDATAPNPSLAREVLSLESYRGFDRIWGGNILPTRTVPYISCLPNAPRAAGVDETGNNRANQKVAVDVVFPSSETWSNGLAESISTSAENVPRPCVDPCPQG